MMRDTGPIRRLLLTAAAAGLLVGPCPAVVLAQTAPPGERLTESRALLEGLMSSGRRTAVRVLAHTRLVSAQAGRTTTAFPFMLTNIGSGVRLGAANRVLTAYSVIADADSIEIQVGARRMPAELMGVDRFTDLALLSVNGLMSSNEPPPVAAEATPGEVVLLADPQGIGLSLVSGHVVPVGTSDLIFTDIKAYEGVSGAPLLNGAGEIAGIVTYSWEGPSGDGPPSAVAVHASEAARIADDLERYGRVRRGYFGATADPEIRGRAILDSVVEGSPAEAAGLRQGDEVTHYGGLEIGGPEDLRGLVLATAPGTAVPLRARRDSLTMDLMVVLGDREDQAPARGERGTWPDGESQAAMMMRWQVLLEELQALMAAPGFDPARPEIQPALSRLENELRQIKRQGTGKPPR